MQHSSAKCRVNYFNASKIFFKQTESVESVLKNIPATLLRVAYAGGDWAGEGRGEKEHGESRTMTHVRAGLALPYCCPNARPCVSVPPGLAAKGSAAHSPAPGRGPGPSHHAPERCEMAAAARGAARRKRRLSRSLSLPARAAIAEKRGMSQAKAGLERGRTAATRRRPRELQGAPQRIAANHPLPAALSRPQAQAEFKPLQLGAAGAASQPKRPMAASPAPRAQLPPFCTRARPAQRQYGAGRERRGRARGGGDVAPRRARGGARAAAVTAFLLRARRPSPPSSSFPPVGAAPSPPKGQKMVGSEGRWGKGRCGEG